MLTYFVFLLQVDYYTDQSPEVKYQICRLRPTCFWFSWKRLIASKKETFMIHRPIWLRRNSNYCFLRLLAGLVQSGYASFDAEFNGANGSICQISRLIWFLHGALQYC